MKRKITSYLQDADGDWVAGLDCGHGQHVRHKPPFINRPWADSAEGRTKMLGTELQCVRCDHMEFPAGLREYKRTPVFTEGTIPKGLLRDHCTKAGTWGLIHILEGRLRYIVNEPEVCTIELQPGVAGIVVPEMKHRVEPVGTVRFCVGFHCSAAP